MVQSLQSKTFPLVFRDGTCTCELKLRRHAGRFQIMPRHRMGVSLGKIKMFPWESKHFRIFGPVSLGKKYKHQKHNNKPVLAGLESRTAAHFFLGR